MKCGTPLTEAEQASIFRLAARLKNPTAYAIAGRLQRNYGTVRWFMIRNSLMGPLRQRAAYQAKGVKIHPYTPQHDARIEELRASNPPLSYSKIARTVTAEFGIKRRWHSVRARLARLASIEDDPATIATNPTQERPHV